MRFVRCLLRIFFLGACSVILSESVGLTQFVPDACVRRRFTFLFFVFRYVIRRVGGGVYGVRLICGCVQVCHVRVQDSFAVMFLCLRHRDVSGANCRVVYVRLFRLRHHFLLFRRERLRRLFRLRARAFNLVVCRSKCVLRRDEEFSRYQVFRRLNHRQCNESEHLRFVYRVICRVVLCLNRLLLARSSVSDGSRHRGRCRYRSR